MGDLNLQTFDALTTELHPSLHSYLPAVQNPRPPSREERCGVLVTHIRQIQEAVQEDEGHVLPANSLRTRTYTHVHTRTRTYTHVHIKISAEFPTHTQEVPLVLPPLTPDP